MTIRIVAAAGALALASLGFAPVIAQMPPPNGMHHDDHGGPGGPGMGGPGMGGGDHRGGPDGAIGGRGPGMDHRDMRGDQGRGDGWQRTAMAHRKHCRTVWRNHHRVKRCG